MAAVGLKYQATEQGILQSLFKSTKEEVTEICIHLIHELYYSEEIYPWTTHHDKSFLKIVMLKKWALNRV